LIFIFSMSVVMPPSACGRGATCWVEEDEDADDEEARKAEEAAEARLGCTRWLGASLSDIIAVQEAGRRREGRAAAGGS
jgi:hypothetical protein